MVSFAEPDRLWLLVVCAVGAACVLARHRRRLILQRRLASPAVWRHVMGGAPATGLVRLLLWVAAASLLVAALARPSWGLRKATDVVVTRDLVIALDVSASMVCPDLPPSRLAFAVGELRHLMPRLAGNRVGVVVFAGDAYPLLPLTHDLEAVSLFLSEVQSGMVARGGSDLERGVRTALGLLPADGLGRVILLVSDGESLDGDPAKAAAAAHEAGVGLIALQAGTEAGGPIPMPDETGEIHYKMRATGQPVMTRADHTVLSKLAAATGGEVFTLGRVGTVTRVAEAIERVRAREVKNRSTDVPVERFAALLAAAAALLILGFLSWPWRRCLVVVLVSLAVPGIAGADLETGTAGTAGGETVVKGASRVAPPLWQRLLPGGGRRLARSGQRHWREGDLDGAVRDFRLALAIDTHDPARLYDLGSALLAVGRFEEAVPLLIEAHVGGMKDAAFNLGTAALARGDVELAVRWLRTALLAAPADADARRNFELALRLRADQAAARASGDRSQESAAESAATAPADGAAAPERRTDHPTVEEQNRLCAALQRADAAARRKMLTHLPTQVGPAGRDW